MLEFVAFLALQLLAIVGELIEQMVDDVGLENPHAQRVGQFLCVAFDLDVERQNRGVSVLLCECECIVENVFRTRTTVSPVSINTKLSEPQDRKTDTEYWLFSVRREVVVFRRSTSTVFDL